MRKKLIDNSRNKPVKIFEPKDNKIMPKISIPTSLSTNQNNLSNVNNTNLINNLNIKTEGNNINNSNEENTIENNLNLPEMSKTLTNFNQKPKNAFNTLGNSVNYVLRNRINSAIPTKRNLYKGHLLPPIPKRLLDRINLYIEIFKNPDFIEYFKKAPSRMSNSLDKITNYLFRYKSNHQELDKYAMFFYYLCNQMTYDIKKVNKDQTDLNKILSSGVANNYQMTKLFEYMCRKKEMKVKHIDGYCKGMDLPYFKVGTDVNDIINHSWNAIFVKNEWYFLDVTFGSGGIKPKGDFVREFFNPFFFLTPPEYLIESHRPKDDEWQFTKKIISTKQFSSKRHLNLGDFYHIVYLKEVKLITHEYPVIYTMNKNMEIKIGLENHLIQVNLLSSNFKIKISEPKFTYNDKNKEFTIEPGPPRNGEYNLRIFGRSLTSTDLIYEHLLTYRIIVDDTQLVYIDMLKNKKLMLLDKENLESQKIKNENIVKRAKSARTERSHKILTSYELISNKNNKPVRDNIGAFILEPKMKAIKFGQDTKVKVKIKGVNAVVVLDGRKWNYLRKKKDEDIWEGIVNIQNTKENEKVTVCTLRDCNVYTEVCDLQVIYSGSTIIQNFKQKQKNLKLKRSINASP